MKHDFCESFRFFRLEFENYNYTDNRAGCTTNYIAEMLCGRARLVTDTQTADLEAGDFFFIPRGCNYRSYWYGEPKIEFFSFGADNIPLPDGVTIPMQRIDVRDERTLERLRALASSIGVGKRADSGDIALFYRLFDELFALMSTECDTGAGRLVDKAEKIMRGDPTLSVPQIASRCGVSESTLYAAFSANSDETPALMRQRLLVEKAELLLVTTNIPIERICDMLGYSSASYFRKMVHKYLGASPREVRRRQGI